MKTKTNAKRASKKSPKKIDEPSKTYLGLRYEECPECGAILHAKATKKKPTDKQAHKIIVEKMKKKYGGR